MSRWRRLRGKIAARAAVITVSSNVLAAGNIKFTPDIPKRQLDAAARLSLGSYDRIALQLPGNPLGLGRDDVIIEQSNSTRTALLFANMGGSSLCALDVAGSFGRDLSARASGDGGLRRRMADANCSAATRPSAVKKSSATRWNAAPFVLGAMSAAAPGGAAVAQNPHRADRLHVPRGRGDPRNAVGNGRRRLGERRARRGSRAAQDRRAQG